MGRKAGKRKREREAGASPPAKRAKGSTRNSVVVPETSDDGLLGGEILREDDDDNAVPSTRDDTDLPLKYDHEERPLWVCTDGRIFLESFHKHYSAAYDFLIAIAEPVSRPKHVHEYHLTPHSLYAAVSIGLSCESIIKQLNVLSKVEVPQTVIHHVTRCTRNFGKVKLVLKHNEFSLESQEPETLRVLLKDPVIADARLRGADGVIQTAAAPAPIVVPGSQAKGPDDAAKEDVPEPNQTDTLAGLLELDEDDQRLETEVHSFRVDPAKIQAVRKRCIELEHPTLEEYDFRNDKINADLPIELKPKPIRPYQEKSLSKMFGAGRARSGMIVLPCGAGKTLVGIIAATTIKKSTMVLCTSAVAVEQWKRQFNLWTDIDDDYICRFTADRREIPDMEGVSIVISTYNMIGMDYSRRSMESKALMDRLCSKEWGLLVLDEVHVVPANTFRQVCTMIHAHAKLGLTATLVREDSLINDLYYLIGPKLYEANWMDLQDAGYIARVQCVEVWSQMAPAFYRAYLKEKNARVRKLLWIMNPDKFRAVKYLVALHEARQDKILIFMDDVFAIKEYGRLLDKPVIHGAVAQADRMNRLKAFQTSSSTNTIIISKVGDNSFDLPEANVLIQVSAHYGSRRQEAQRLGRILRKKPGAPTEGFNAFFYSIVSRGTQEMYYTAKRQQFLINQGYAFKVVTQLSFDDIPPLSDEEQIRLIDKCRATQERVEDLDDVVDDLNSRQRPGVSRSRGSLSTLSGAGGAFYSEQTVGKAAVKARQKLFVSRDKERAKLRKERQKRQQQQQGS